jgi:hypothetical protein
MMGPFYLPCALGSADVEVQTFAKKDLPKEHRVVQAGGMSTMDFKPDRVNVHVGDDGTVHKVTKG